MEQAKFTYSHMGKCFVKETKTNEDQGQKQIKTIEDKKNVYQILMQMIIKVNY